MKLNHLMLSVMALVATPTYVYAADGHAAPHWDYQSADKWGSLDPAFAACDAGKSQSPINIKMALDGDLNPIAISYQPVAPAVLNNGHTIQVNVPEGSSIKSGNSNYALLQFHFHTPSEYQIEGRVYPLELHFVHKSAEGALGVIGVMFEEGAANPELDKIWANAPTAAGETKSPADVSLDLSKLLPADQRYYRFMGSLTTPPCSEGVNWHMMQRPITA